MKKCQKFIDNNDSPIGTVMVGIDLSTHIYTHEHCNSFQGSLTKVNQN